MGVPLIRGGGYLTDFLTTWVLFVLGSAVFISVTHTRFSRDWVRLVVRLYVVMALFVAIFGIAQFIIVNVLGNQLLYIEPTSVTYESSTGYGARLGFLRPNSVFAEPRHFGNFLVTPFFASIVGAHPDVKLFEKRTGLFIATVLLGGIVLSFSASTYLTFFLSVLVLPLLVQRDKAGMARMYATLAVSLAVVFSLALLMVDTGNILYTIERLFVSPETLGYIQAIDLEALSTVTGGPGRYLGGILGALILVAKYPLTGVGLNQFYSYYPELWILPPFRFLMEAGLVATGLLGLFLLSLIRKVIALKQRVNDPLDYRLLQIAMIVMVVLVLKSSMASNYGYASTWFWTDISLSGLILYTCQRRWADRERRPV
jgi:hypothetical protein